MHDVIVLNMKVNCANARYNNRNATMAMQTTSCRIPQTLFQKFALITSHSILPL